MTQTAQTWRSFTASITGRNGRCDDQKLLPLVSDSAHASGDGETASLAETARRFRRRSFQIAVTPAGMGNQRLILGGDTRTSMAQDNSFDIVSKVDIQEVRNAIDQAMKEIRQRFDLKDSHSDIKLEGSDSHPARLRERIQARSREGDSWAEAGEARCVAEVPHLRESWSRPRARACARRSRLQQGIPTEKAKEIVRSSRTQKRRRRQAFKAIL